MATNSSRALVPVVVGTVPDLLALDLAEGGDLDVIVGLAIGGGNHHPAACAGRQTAVDAIAVGIVADDEYPRFGLRSRAAAPAMTSAANRYRIVDPHSRLSGRSKRNTDLAERLKAPLTEPRRPHAEPGCVSGLWRYMTRT